MQRRGGTQSPGRLAVVIAADGRRSTLAFALGLARHPRRPRRWAIGAYFEGVTGLSTSARCTCGAATTSASPRARRPDQRVPGRARRQARAIGAASAEASITRVRHDPQLGPRFARARRATPATMLGPLAVDVTAPASRGLLLAGDAAGFVDPMTGDGLRLAMRGGELAAEAALESLEGQRRRACAAGRAPAGRAGRQASRQSAAAVARRAARRREHRRRLRHASGRRC